jgi:hypothetical protein
MNAYLSLREGNGDFIEDSDGPVSFACLPRRGEQIEWGGATYIVKRVRHFRLPDDGEPSVHLVCHLATHGELWK